MKVITSFEELDLQGSYTYADYLKWQFQERLELLKGKIFKMSPAPSTRHQRISGICFGMIWTILDKKPCSCQVFSAPFDVRLIRKDKKTDKEIITVVQPDICVICDENKIDERGCIGSPDLIIEILSPGYTKKEMKEKYEVYEESGVKEYWLVEPNDEIVLVYILNDEGKYIGLKPFTTDEILTSKVLPEFSIDINSLF
jgi:Uma2 family endonuclease